MSKAQQFNREKFDAILAEPEENPVVAEINGYIAAPDTPQNVKDILSTYLGIFNSSLSEDEYNQIKNQCLYIQNDFDITDYAWFADHPNLIASVLDQNCPNILEDSGNDDGSTILDVLRAILNRRPNTTYYVHDPNIKKKQIPITREGASSITSNKIKQLAALVGQLHTDLKQIKDAQTLKGAETYVKKQNEKLGKQIYRAYADDTYHDGDPEIYIEKRPYNLATHQYGEYEPYMVNGWKIARKDMRKQLYMKDIQDKFQFGSDRRKNKKAYKEANNGIPYPSFEEWKTTKLIKREVDPTDKYRYIITKGEGITDEDYSTLTKWQTPRETRSPKSVFTSMVSNLIKSIHEDKNERTVWFNKYGGFISIASRLYKYFISDPVEQDLLQEYEINNPNEMKKMKTKSVYKESVKKRVNYYFDKPQEVSDYINQTYP